MAYDFVVVDNGKSVGTLHYSSAKILNQTCTDYVCHESRRNYSCETSCYFLCSSWLMKQKLPNFQRLWILKLKKYYKFLFLRKCSEQMLKQVGCGWHSLAFVPFNVCSDHVADDWDGFIWKMSQDCSHFGFKRSNLTIINCSANSPACKDLYVNREQ
jgi:hypothetical protein